MQGTIIEYVEHGKFICAIVTAQQGSRLHLLNQNGREINLPKNRVVHQSSKTIAIDQGRDQLIKHLQDTASSRQAIKLPVSLAEIWQFITEERDQQFQPKFLTELCFSDETGDDQIAAFTRAIFNDKTYFKYKGELILAHSPETVEQLMEKKERERQKEIILQSGAKALKKLSEGIETDNWPRQDCLNILQDYYLFDKDAEQWQLARELLQRSSLTKPHDVFHILVATGRWHKNQNIHLLRQQVPLDFSDEALSQAEVIVENSDSAVSTDRLDLRHLPVLTIDGASTRDFDDALHVEQKGDNFEVGIHITDVARYIAPRSPLFNEAEARTTSIYLPDSTVPMLPKVLSEGSLSLIEGKDRAAVSFIITLSSDGDILNSKIVRSLVQVKRQLSYDMAEAMLDDDTDLQHLVMLSKKLQQKRISNDALIILVPDVVFRFDRDHQSITDIVLNDVDSTMRVLVSEFMILANSLGAKFLADRQEPGLFRSQDLPNKRFFTQPEHDLFINFRQRRFLSRGHLTTTPKRHSGVGVEQYTTLTSPIRRLLDLVVQHQIVSILSGQGSRFSESEMSCFGSIITSAQSKVNLVRQLRHRYWLFKFLETKAGSRLPAIVLDKRNRKVQVVLKDFLFESDLPANQATHLELGDIITVKLSKVSALDNTIRLEW